MVRAWRAFRDWRRSRPFWGGLLLLLAGVELLAIPLLSVLAHGSVKVVIYIGIGGVFGVLIGGLLVACGLLIWFHPVQRVFYAIAGVLLAVASFVATNLGGFFFGMLLGVTGASLSFGWTPGPGRLAGQHRPRPRAAGPASDGLGLVLDGRPSADASGRPGRSSGAGGSRHVRGRPRGPVEAVSRRLALAVMPLALAGLLLPGRAAGAAQPAAAARPGCIIPILCPSPSPTPTPAPSGSSSPQPAPSASPTPTLARHRRPGAFGGCVTHRQSHAGSQPACVRPRAEGLVGQGRGRRRAGGQRSSVQPGYRLGAAARRVVQGSGPGPHGERADARR